MLAYKSFEVDILGDLQDIHASYKDSTMTIRGLSVEAAMDLLQTLERMSNGDLDVDVDPPKPSKKYEIGSLFSKPEPVIVPRKEPSAKEANEIFDALEKSIKEKEQFTSSEWGALCEEVESAYGQYLINEDEEKILFRWLNARRPSSDVVEDKSTFSVSQKFEGGHDPDQIALSFAGKEVSLPKVPSVSGEIAKTEEGRALGEAFRDADRKAQETPEDDDDLGVGEELKAGETLANCEAPGCGKKGLPYEEYEIGGPPDFLALCLDCAKKQKDAAKKQEEIDDEFDREVEKIKARKDEEMRVAVQEHKAKTATPIKELEHASKHSQALEEKLLRPAPKLHPEAPANGFLSDVYLSLKEEIGALDKISVEDAKPFKKRIAEWGNTEGATQDQCLVLTNLLGSKIESVLTSGELPKKTVKPKKAPLPAGTMVEADDATLKSAQTVREATHYLMSRGVSDPASIIAKIEAIAPEAEYLRKVQGLRGRIETAISTYSAK